MNSQAQIKAEEFLKVASLYRLGDLPTESRHPLTTYLSDWAQNDLKRAIEALVEVDCLALETLSQKISSILELRSHMQSVIKNKNKIFICGCGATGRLSLAIETLWREMFGDQDQVIAFMAGGDMALVHSLEGFEDFPQYGERQLLELGFAESDLLIGVTEGGETPYVIGATEAAARISKVSPYFIYCNPDEILCSRVERSRKVIQNEKIKKINLTVGPMALSGSTRMQASTVLQLALSYALLSTFDSAQIQHSLEGLKDILKENSVSFLTGFIERESQTYNESDYVLYSVRDLILTVFTDTTERAPTFSLTPFSHPQAKALLKRTPSLCYIEIPTAKNSSEAWHKLLLREPRALNWTEIDSRTSEDYMKAFDFSPQAASFRRQIIPPTSEHRKFEIELQGDGFLKHLCWRLMDHERTLQLKNKEIFEIHILLKMLINIQSTLVMGRLGRYKNNVMTWVHPTNGKLIDRASRYVLALLQDQGVEKSYEQVVYSLFEQMDSIETNESVVLKTYAHLLKG